MGDRANVFIADQPEDPTRGIYLYSHWGGYEWPETLRLALATEQARDRWTDSSYLTRILIHRMYEDLERSSTGGGVSTGLTDNEYPITVLRFETWGTVPYVAWAKVGEEGDPDKHIGRIGVAEFVALKKADYPADLMAR